MKQADPWNLKRRQQEATFSRTLLFSLASSSLGLSNPCGARKGKTSRAAHGLYRPTHERPAADSPSAEPTERWCSDSGKAGANVTGKSAQADGLHPSWALGLHSTEAACRRSGMAGFTSHPADLMERA